MGVLRAFLVLFALTFALVFAAPADFKHGSVLDRREARPPADGRCRDVSHCDDSRPPEPVRRNGDLALEDSSAKVVRSFLLDDEDEEEEVGERVSPDRRPHDADTASDPTDGLQSEAKVQGRSEKEEGVESRKQIQDRYESTKCKCSGSEKEKAIQGRSERCRCPGSKKPIQGRSERTDDRYLDTKLQGRSSSTDGSDSENEVQGIDGDGARSEYPPGTAKDKAPSRRHSRPPRLGQPGPVTMRL